MTDSAPLAVLHVIRPAEAGSLGGADLHVLDLCAAQAEMELCRPAVLALNASDDFLRRADLLGVPVHDPMSRRKGRWRLLASLPRDLEVNLVHAHGYHADYAAALLPFIARAWSGLPRVFTCHGIITPDLRHEVMSRLDLLCMRRADLLVAVSEPSSAMLRRKLRKADVRVIANGVLPPRRVVGPTDRLATRSALGASDAERVLVGYVGRLSPEKRPDLFLRAATIVAQREPRATFVYIGGGGLDRAVRQAVESSGIKDRVMVAGLQHDMDAVYAALDILALPSDIEGTSRALLEAQIRGVPAVATAVGGTPSVMRDGRGGLLVPPGDDAALAEAIVRLVRDDGFRKRLGDTATVETRSRTAHAMAREVQTAYVDAYGRAR